jgi:hypothetical protein
MSFIINPLSTEISASDVLPELIKKLNPSSPFGYFFVFSKTCPHCIDYLAEYNRIVEAINQPHTFFHQDYATNPHFDKGGRLFANEGVVPRVFIFSPKEPPKLIDRSEASIIEYWRSHTSDVAIPQSDKPTDWSQYIAQETPTDQNPLIREFKILSQIKKVKGTLYIPL